MRQPGRKTTLLYYAIGLALATLILGPFLWPLSASFQNESALFRQPPPFVPSPPTLDNYAYVFTGRIPQAYDTSGLLRSRITQEARVIPAGLANSLTVSSSVVLLNLVLGTLAGYTFARERFRGRSAAFMFILGSRLLPPIAVAIPIFMILRQLDLLDTKTSLILIHSAFTLPFTVWVLTLYFRSLPEEIEDAALVDGCTRFGVLRRVVLPLSLPGLAAVGTFSFLFSYNEFLFALLATSTPRAKTMPVVLTAIAGNPDASFTLIATGLVLSIIAPMALALVFRRYLTSGLVASLTGESR